MLISSLRDEEQERMPRITNSINGLVNEIKVIKSKSEFIMYEMVEVERKFKTFQNNIQDAISQITTKTDEVLIFIFFLRS
jgi:predicted  nucleic acid-binding Zn-ribbon protein